MADLLINAEVLLDHGEVKQMAKVLRRSVDENGVDGSAVGRDDCM